MADELTIAMRLRGARAVNSELATTNKELAAMRRNARNAAAPLMGVSKGLNAVGSTLTRRVSLPLAIAGGASVKMAMDFDKGMTRIKTLVGVGSKQVDSWREKVLAMSRETGVAANELGEALYFVTSSGLALNKALSVTRAVAKGTALGIGESGTIAQLVTSAMNAYAKSNLSASHTMDVLIAGTKAGKLEAADLSESLGRVLPIASRLGVPLEEVVGSMEAMSLTGADAEQAATQLSAFFSGLVKVTPQAAKQLAKFSLTGAGLRDDLSKKGLPFVIGELDKAFDGNVEAMAKVFPNIRALRAQLGLTGDQAENVNRVFEATRNNSGSLGRAWEELTNSKAFKLQRAINELKVAAILFGTALMPIVIAVAKAVTPLAQGIGKMGDAGVILVGVLIALGPLLKLSAFGLRIFAAQAALAEGATFAAAAGTTSFAAALLALPITWIVLGLVAIGVGLFILYKRVRVFREAVQGTFAWIKAHWRLLAVLIGGPLGLQLVIVVNHFKTIKRWAEAVYRWVMKIVHAVSKIHFPHVPGSGLLKKGGGLLGKGAGLAEGILGGLATGGPVMQSGRYVVGEKGPEVVTLPRGAHVDPNGGGGGELVTVPVVLTMDGKVVAEQTARVTADRRARR